MAIGRLRHHRQLLRDSSKMMKTITPTEILDYYDGVDIFAGCDRIGGNYVGLRVGTEANLDRYLVAGISPHRLRHFRSGRVDLRTLFMETDSDGWFFTIADGAPGEPLTLESGSGPVAATGLLPQEGYFLEDMPIDDFVLQEALERRNVVFEFSADPPETARGHRMNAMTLAGLLTLMQTAVKHSYRKAVADLTDQTRSLIHRSDGHEMDVVIPASAGSFRVLLEASKPPDMFGSGELVRAFRKLDDVFACLEDLDNAPKSLQAYQGHLAGSCVKLMRFLAEHNTGLKYGWADPAFSEVHYGGVSQEAAHKLADSFGGFTNLVTESVTISGAFVRVNIPTGEWGLYTEEEGRKIGKLSDDSPSLDGLITGNHYRFNCIEDIEIDPLGNDKHTLYLQSIKKL